RVRPPEHARPLEVEPLCEFLQGVSRWDASRWTENRVTYQDTYGPIPLLPPECQNAVILQASVGNLGGRAFGRGPVTEHRVRSASDFEEHARAVSTLLGHRVLQCRNIFLGASDVLRRPAGEVDSYLETIGRVFPITERSEPRNRDIVGVTPALEGIHAFLDDFVGMAAGLEDWKRFRKLHLRRITFGVESGDAQVRVLYGKTWRDDDLIATVADAKQAGLGVSLAVLVGAGGLEHSDRHVASTTELFQELPLGQGDLIALLDAEEVRDPRAEALGFSPLIGQAWDTQQARFKQALTSLRTGRGVKVMPYLLEKQGS
ncbi:radical SAM protein, partial [Singulisphaera rosea]